MLLLPYNLEFFKTLILTISEVYCTMPVGDRSVVLRPRKLKYAFGMSVKYLCRAGKFPKSTSDITCQADGQWDDTPACEGKVFLENK